MIRTAATVYGKVRGIPAANPSITAFKGIPFAAPPVGSRRWAAPAPCEPWTGVKDCLEFAPISVQDTPGIGDNIYIREWHVDPEIPMDEDCLYLNVWTPAKTAEEKLPVFVWFFGGGFQWGYTAEMEFDGERIARRGIVVVTVNYRLGALGYLAHPELTAEAPETPTNFGMLDQQFALKWVRDNIAAFGGDPSKVTIGGQSAGGGSVCNQMANPKNTGLFRSAFVMSGMIYAGHDDSILKALDLKEAEALGESFFDFLGVKTLEEARALPWLTIRDRYAAFAENHKRMAPVIDGCFIPEAPLDAFFAGRGLPVSVMAGNTKDEFPAKFGIEQTVKTAFKGWRNAGREEGMYYYRFDADIPGEDHPGTFHSVDLWFFFETLAKCWRPYDGHHYDLARQMCEYLCNFIKNGDPNGNDQDGRPLQTWISYSEHTPYEMNFTEKGCIAHREDNT